MFDWFVALLRCPACGTVSPPTSVTNMQTHLRDDADGSELGVGTQLDPLDLRRNDILNSGYMFVSDPVLGKTICLLETWECPFCGRGDNWARITISGTEITNIEAVTLNRTTLDAANFISKVQADLLAEASMGEEPASGESSVEILRRRLP